MKIELNTHERCMIDFAAQHPEVLVLSARPGRIRKRVPVKFDLADRTPMRSRNAPEFKDYFNTIWKELNDHA